MVNVVIEVPKVAYGSYTRLSLLLGLIRFLRGLPSSLEVDTSKIVWEFVLNEKLKNHFSIHVESCADGEEGLGARIIVAVREAMCFPFTWNEQYFPSATCQSRVQGSLKREDRAVPFGLARTISDEVGIDWTAAATHVYLAPAMSSMC